MNISCVCCCDLKIEAEGRQFWPSVEKKRNQGGLCYQKVKQNQVKLLSFVVDPTPKAAETGIVVFQFSLMALFIILYYYFYEFN